MSSRTKQTKIKGGYHGDEYNDEEKHVVFVTDVGGDSVSGVFEVQAKDAKHIILLIGDGMNIEHEIATSRYLYGKDFELSFHKLPYQANVATWDVSTYKDWSGGSYDPNAIDPSGL